MFIPRRHLCVCALVLLAGPVTAAEPLGDALAWFENLGFPNVRGCPYVRVAIGNPWINEKGLREGTYCDGFLLSEKGDQFTVFLGGQIMRGNGSWNGLPLCVMTFVRTPRGTPENESVDYTPLNLKNEAERAANFLKGAKETDSSSSGNYLDPRAAAFVLARNCLENGLDSEAQKLLTEAERLRAMRPPQNPGDGSFREALAEHLGEVLMMRAVLEIEDPALSYRNKIGVERPMRSRAELLTIFERLEQNFPEGPRGNGWGGLVNTLRQMAREDKTHRPRAWDEMSKAGQIEEWIFRLRDQPGWTRSRPGSCDIFLMHRGGNESVKYPADHLLRFGFAAVPALIQALKDERFCRAIDEGSGMMSFPKFLTIGECARQILERIASRNFPPGAASKETAEEVQAWWTALQDKGEASLLVENVRTGDWNSMRQASRLLEAYPGIASAAIAAGIQNASRNTVRKFLVETLGRAKDDASRDVLRNEMRSADSLEMRLSAAQALYGRNDAQALPAMISEWEKAIPDYESLGSDAQNTVGDLGEFLVGSGNPSSIEILTRGFSKYPPKIRLCIVNAMIGARFSISKNSRLSLKEASASNAMVERMLISALDDTWQAKGFSMSCDAWEIDVHDPRICDMAAFKLSEWWPEKYSFKWLAAPGAGDRQIAAIKAVAHDITQ